MRSNLPARSPRRIPLAGFLSGAGVLALASSLSPDLAQGSSDIMGTRHNLSVSGTGQVRAFTEDRVCIFCHTPHNATPLSPLWNKDLEPQVYTVYASPTLQAVSSETP